MTKATVLPVTVLRRDNNEGYNLIIESPLPGFPGDSIETDTHRLNLAIERWVDKEPAQYGWSYPRFRERPHGEPRFY
jgi:lauroyl/myristoyl acyltransferase